MKESKIYVMRCNRSFIFCIGSDVERDVDFVRFDLGDRKVLEVRTDLFRWYL